VPTLNALTVVRNLAEGMDSSSQLAAVLSLSGVVITGLLTALTAIRSGKDKRERNADRRKIEEETTDVILKRVRRELDRAYEVIDIKDSKLRKYARFLAQNRSRFESLGIQVPDIDPDDDGPSLREEVRSIRVEVDQAVSDRRDEDDELIREDRRHRA
jgi:hypothetical protein